MWLESEKNLFTFLSNISPHSIPTPQWKYTQQKIWIQYAYHQYVKKEEEVEESKRMKKKKRNQF